MEYNSPEIYDLEMADFQEDIPFYRDLAKKAGGPVLELGCGTGRVSIPLARAGLAMTGLDLSEKMLGRAWEKSREAGVSIRWVPGDMSRFDLGRRFALVILPFNSIQHMTGPARIRGLLRSVRRHLKPEASFAFDVYNPDMRKVKRKRAYLAFCYRDPQKGGRVQVFVRNRYDPKRNINQVLFDHRLRGRTVFREAMAMRCFIPDELDRLLKENGFELTAKYGGFDRSPFEKNSHRQIVIARSTRPERFL